MVIGNRASSISTGKQDTPDQQTSCIRSAAQDFLRPNDRGFARTLCVGSGNPPTWVSKSIARNKKKTFARGLTIS